MSDASGVPQVVLASGNAGKVREFAELLAGLAIELRPATAGELAHLPEEGAEYEPNARVKAETIARVTGLPALADDSGLEVDGLDGAPGPLSARYGGPGLDDEGRVAHLLAELARRPGAERGARFVCVAALARPDGTTEVRRATCEGRILDAPRGRDGFGYDPIFQPEGVDGSAAELPAEVKNRISHRGRALAALRDALEALAAER